ncbi:MAG TPA: TauD/TfdA family dioxygenase [Acidimicrobiales bacterium]|nr:TauD/TfdA family dioxygenase [Acidimicrobiales bacterium]
MSVTTQQITPEIGLEVTGLAGHELVDPARAAECQAALDAHGVVVYREAGIGDADLLAFTEMLGTVVIPKMGGLEEHPGVDVISLDPAESSLAKYRRSTIFWHLDGTTDELPQKATLLTALVVADEGGDTEFAHTYAAYAALPEDEKARLADLRVEHSLAAAQLMFTPEPTEKQRAAWDQVPSRVHPLVWRRRDGRRSLLIGSTAGRIVDLPEDESRALLDHLLEWVTQPRFVLRHHWRPGDLVVWDNTGLLHRAIPYEATSHRLLHRTTLVGEEAIA